MPLSFTAADGTPIYAEAYLPQGDVRAVIVLVHGLAEHSGRYQHVFKLFTEKGYAVYTLDHRTHGRSGGEPRVYIPDFSVVVEDLRLLVEKAKAAHPGKKLFIYGHSMGSFISLLYLLKYQKDAAGLIATGCPLTADTTVPSYMVTVGNLLNVIVPKMPLIKIALDTVSRDPAVVKAYMEDPYVHAQPVRVRMAVGYNNALRPLRERLHEFTLPMLILHGEADQIAPKSGSELLHSKAASTDKTLKIYPGLYHEIHNEPEQAQVFADMLTWLDARA